MATAAEHDKAIGSDQRRASAPTTGSTDGSGAHHQRTPSQPLLHGPPADSGTVILRRVPIALCAASLNALAVIIIAEELAALRTQVRDLTRQLSDSRSTAQELEERVVSLEEIIDTLNKQKPARSQRGSMSRSSSVDGSAGGLTGDVSEEAVLALRRELAQAHEALKTAREEAADARGQLDDRDEQINELQDQIGKRSASAG